MGRLFLLTLMIVPLGVAACTTTPEDGSQKIETTKEAERESIKGVAEAPLRDINLLRTKIPPVLLAAVADPYQRPEMPRKVSRDEACDRLRGLVGALDEALGPDLDVPVEQQGLAHRGRDAAMGWMATAASDAVPFHSWIRKLSGAERHDQLVQNAITSGAVRRAYLKGLGEARGCDPPATPSHVRAGTPPPTQEVKVKLKPLYPF
jgi:hypothetical protein